MYHESVANLRAYPKTEITKTSEFIYHGGTENTEKKLNIEYRISNIELLLLCPP